MTAVPEAPDSPAPAHGSSGAGPYHALRVARVIEETADARSFVIDVPADLRAQFGYEAGQFLTFRLEVAGERLVRCYSLASSPDTDTEHKVTVKRVADGRVSNWMNDRVRAGDVLETMRPAGVFVLQDRATPLVLFGAGSGITPVISIVKSALARTSRRVRLVYANRDAGSIIFRDELDALAAAHGDRLEVVHRLDVDHGFLDAAGVRAYVGADLDADFYVCGPTPFMDTVESTLGALGVPDGQIFVERFVSIGDPHGAVHASPESKAGDAAPATVRVRLDGQDHDVPYAAGKTLLAAAREAGLEPPFACEEGYCSCCMAKLVRGSVRMAANDALDAKQLAEGWVLTCQSVPTSDEVEVEYPD